MAQYLSFHNIVSIEAEEPRLVQGCCLTRHLIITHRTHTGVETTTIELYASVDSPNPLLLSTERPQLELDLDLAGV